MKCENCLNEYDILYGGGRFCSKKCACSFSTKEKRKEINQKVSEKLKGKPYNGFGFVKGFDKRRNIIGPSNVNDKYRIEKIKTFHKQKIENTPFENLCKRIRRKIVIENQNGKCLWCKISKWRNEPLSLQLDHIDGNKNNNNRDNVRALCPNCHSQTHTFAVRNTIGGRKKNFILQSI